MRDNPLYTLKSFLSISPFSSALIPTLYCRCGVVLYVGYTDGHGLSDADIETAMQALADLTFGAFLRGENPFAIKRI